MKYFNI